MFDANQRCHNLKDASLHQQIALRNNYVRRNFCILLRIIMQVAPSLAFQRGRIIKE